jgi:hypothetical protein
MVPDSMLQAARPLLSMHGALPVPAANSNPEFWLSMRNVMIKHLSVIESEHN